MGLLAGTLVATANGPRAIETLAVGDVVVSTDVRRRKGIPPRPGPMRVASHRVNRIARVAATEVIELALAHAPFTCGSAQPILVAERGWIAARDLTAGMILVGRSGPHSITAVASHTGAFLLHRIEVDTLRVCYANETVVLADDNDDAPQVPSPRRRRTNARMEEWLALATTLVNVRVPYRFQALVAAGIRRVGRVWLFDARVTPEHANDPLWDDETGVECKSNDVYLSEMLATDMASEAPALAATALACASHLATSLEATGGGPFRIIVSVREDGTGTLRFHKLREGRAWLSDNLEGFLEEGILVIDTL